MNRFEWIHSHQTLFCWLFMLAVTAVITGLYVAVATVIHWCSQWRPDSRNPWRRYCKHCGTQQDYWIDPVCGNGWYVSGIEHNCRRQHRSH